jgi:FtsZ-binding cell division protein ZapB
MNTPVSQRLLQISVDELRQEINALLDKQNKLYAREVVRNERAIAALDREFRIYCQAKDRLIAELEKKLKLVIDGLDRKGDDIEKLKNAVGRNTDARDRLAAEVANLDRENETRIGELERRIGRY